jgi:hypothetical protein
MPYGGAVIFDTRRQRDSRDLFWQGLYEMAVAFLLMLTTTGIHFFRKYVESDFLTNWSLWVLGWGSFLGVVFYVLRATATGVILTARETRLDKGLKWLGKKIAEAWNRRRGGGDDGEGPTGGLGTPPPSGPTPTGGGADGNESSNGWARPFRVIMVAFLGADNLLLPDRRLQHADARQRMNIGGLVNDVLKAIITGTVAAAIFKLLVRPLAHVLIANYHTDTLLAAVGALINAVAIGAALHKSRKIAVVTAVVITIAVVYFFVFYVR